MDEHRLVELYAKTWNTLNSEIIEPYLADDVVYESQKVLSALNGKDKVLRYIEGKMRTIKRNVTTSDVYAEVGHCGSQDGYRIQVWSAEEFKPCVIMAQGSIDNIMLLVLLEVEDGKIKRIDLCTDVPHPSTAIRSGEYPE